MKTVYDLQIKYCVLIKRSRKAAKSFNLVKFAICAVKQSLP